MDPLRWQKVREVYHAALDIAEAERAGFLQRECLGDDDLRLEVESLLSYQAGNEDFMSHSLGAVLLDELGRAAAPGQVGAYRLVRELGAGGMGSVYLAQREGEFRQEVAVKLVRAGLDSMAIFARFVRERQILASLEHPNIARLIDGGRLEDGRPYFVMEYVRGRTLIDYCDSMRLSIADRLTLFRQVCSAVTHAHARLVVHRDLKPGNILVTAEGVPKLLDFGLARLLENRSDPDLTATGMRMMTVAYASPEQVLGKPVTVATDIYSLAVILYELLTGARPYDVSSSSPIEAARTICETEPPAPGAAQPPPNRNPAEVAGLRRISPAGLKRTLEGDLGTIVMMALRKDPERRYRSIEQFSDDLLRYLHGQPIVARGDSPVYRMGKLLARNRLAIGAAALALAGLSTGLVVALRENARAERRFEEVHQLANSMLFELHDAIRPLPGSTAARELLVKRAIAYLDNLAREAENRPRLELDIGKAYRRLGDVEGGTSDTNTGDPAAAESFRKSVRLLEHFHSNSPRDREGLRELAQSYASASMAHNDDSGVEMARKALALLSEDSAAHPDDAQARRELALGHYHMAFAQSGRERFAEAEEEYRKALAVYQSLPGSGSVPSLRRNIALVLKRIGGIQIRTQQLGAALASYEEARRLDAALLAENENAPGQRLDLSFDLGDIGLIMCRIGDHQAEAARYRESVALRELAVASDPKDARARQSLAVALARLGRALRHAGDLAGARRALERGLEKAQAIDAVRHTAVSAELVGGAEFGLAAVHAAAHDCVNARRWLDQAAKRAGANGLDGGSDSDAADVRASCGH